MPSGIRPLPWVARTAWHRLVLPDLQNLHSRHSAVYSGITWSPTSSEVTPSPTASTMPPPSWPRMAGKMPSGSSPDSVKASVWHTPLATMRTSTSPFFGGSTSTSTICSGCLGPKATAARDLMVMGRFSLLLGRRRSLIPVSRPFLSRKRRRRAHAPGLARHDCRIRLSRRARRSARGCLGGRRRAARARRSSPCPEAGWGGRSSP